MRHVNEIHNILSNDIDENFKIMKITENKSSWCSKKKVLSLFELYDKQNNTLI